MIPNGRPSESNSSHSVSAQESRLHETLPPPEWTTPRADLSRGITPRPLARRSGARAEEAWLRARVEAARATGDAASTRGACAALARWLASRDRDLNEAVELGAEALQLGQDLELRRELSAWLESLGEPARAAAVLKPIASLADVESTEAADVLVRVGLLRSRAGATAAAGAAFEAAMAVDGVDPHPGELLGTLSAWQPEVVSIPAAVEAYVESARRHAARKQQDAELVDLWRAFTAAPSSGAAASALADSLERRGRAAAADEVLRAHAQALAPTDSLGAARVHAHRRTSAVLAREPARAFGAAIDEGLGTMLEGDGSEAFDALLLDLGMLEALATRLELRAERSREASKRAAELVQLGRLQAGPLANERRATLAYVAALAADPSSEEAIAALRAQVQIAREHSRGDSDSQSEDSLTAVAVSIAEFADEGERRARLVAKLMSVLPSVVGADTGRDDEVLDDRESAAAEWVRESVGGGTRQASTLERLAATQAAPVRAVLFAAAAECHLAAGNATAARDDAELATRTDPTNARCVAALADASLAQHRDHKGAAALERAIGVIGPRASWCFALADTLDTLGETELAAGWSQRCLDLHPGDRKAIELLLDRLVRAGDPSRLRDALGWLLTQPQPASWAADPFARALTALAQLDTDRAAVVARRALEVFGPKAAGLRDAMLAVAERASDDAFAVAILERWLSSGAEGSDRRRLLLGLAERRERLGDDEGAARVVARAVLEGIRGPEIDRRIGLVDVGTPDAQLSRMRATAEQVSAGDDAAAAAWAWRDLGAALWDLADDRVGAIDAWQRAARTGPGGHATLTLDLIAFAGAPFAFEYLGRLVQTEPDDALSAAVAADVASAALSVGEARHAFDMAARGLARDPRCAQALAAAEHAACPAGEEVALSAIYDWIAASSLGRFGRRAAHYRGARFFERSGDCALALKHAAQAFHAVPSEGATFQFLARTADRAGDRAQAVSAVEQVAESEPRAAVRAMWLERAASIAGDDEDGVRRKMDVLLAAVVASPSVATVAKLRTVARKLLGFSPDDRDSLELRLSHAARSIGRRLDGPDGARISLAFAVALLELFGDSAGALASVERAFACDADVEEFGLLLDHAPQLGQAAEVSSRISTLLATADSPHVNVGVGALRLLAAIGAAAGDDALRARASIAAALRAPQDDTLVLGADDAVRAEPALAERIGNRIPPARRAAALVAAARARVAAGAVGDAAPFFERAADLLDGPARSEIERELRAVLDAAGRGDEIEARVHREAVTPAGSPRMRADRWMEIAQLRERRGDTSGAVKALLEACALDAEPLERWSELERVADIAGDDKTLVSALEKIETRVGDDGRPTVLRRLARAHDRHRDLKTAELTWRRVLALDPEDEEADQAIQSVVVARGEYDALVEHLARRAERLKNDPHKREMLRAMRLRRAAILEQRLGRTKEACDELELLLREWPDSVGALRYLADLLDRQSDFARSAQLWQRAASLEENAVESEELRARAARASSAAGDFDSSQEHGKRRLGHPPFSPASVEPAVPVGTHLPEGDLQRAKNPLERARARLALARRRLDLGQVESAEPLLWEALADGATEAGDVLAPLVASSPDRTSELVRIRWQQIVLEPGDVDRLDSLRVAAVAAADPVHALAVEHVLRAFDTRAGPLLPPPLASQPEQPGILALLVRPSMDAAGEAIALLWEGAMQLFLRDAASYGISGLERVVPGPSSPIARLYELAIRVLDVPRIPLFVARSQAGALESHVALLAAPSVILGGDMREETPALRFELGRGIAAALPCNLLLRALPTVEGRAVIEALRTAFGPPELGKQVDARVARLAESFWQMIPAGAQRRLQDVLRAGMLADYEALVEAGVQSGRRVGMFLAGDFACAARTLLAESAAHANEVITLENLRARCAEAPALADLLCLAVRSEYADARWHSVLSASQRRSVSSGRFKLF